MDNNGLEQKNQDKTVGSVSQDPIKVTASNTVQPLSPAQTSEQISGMNGNKPTNLNKIFIIAGIVGLVVVAGAVIATIIASVAGGNNIKTISCVASDIGYELISDIKVDEKKKQVIGVDYEFSFTKDAINYIEKNSSFSYSSSSSSKSSSSKDDEKYAEAYATYFVASMLSTLEGKKGVSYSANEAAGTVKLTVERVDGIDPEIQKDFLDNFNGMAAEEILKAIEQGTEASIVDSDYTCKVK